MATLPHHNGLPYIGSFEEIAQLCYHKSLKWGYIHSRIVKADLLPTKNLKLVIAVNEKMNFQLQYDLLKDEAEKYPDMMYSVLLGCLKASILGEENLVLAKKYLLAYEQLKKEGKLKGILPGF